MLIFSPPAKPKSCKFIKLKTYMYKVKFRYSFIYSVIIIIIVKMPKPMSKVSNVIRKVS